MKGVVGEVGEVPQDLLFLKKLSQFLVVLQELLEIIELILYR